MKTVDQLQQLHFRTREWMIHLYSALLCITVHLKRFTIMRGGHSSITTSVLMRRQPQYHGTSAHTSYRWRGERVKEPIKWIKLNPFKLPVNRFLWLVFRMERIWWTRAFWSSTHSSGRITGSPVKCSMGSVLTSTATGCAGSATRAGKGSMKSTL